MAEANHSTGIGVYKIVCSASGVVYIGGTTHWKKRIKRHLDQLACNEHHNATLQASWNLHGKDSFHFIWIRDTSKEDLHDEEQREFENYPKRCNIALFSDAPMRGRNHSEVTKKLMCGRTPSMSMLGKHHTDETKALMSRIRSGKPIPALHGRKHSSEHNQAISKSLLGNTRRFESGKGYTWHKGKNRWMVSVCGKFGGYFRCEEDAQIKAGAMRDEWRISRIENNQ